MIQVNRIYLIFNRLVTKKFLVDTSDKIIFSNCNYENKKTPISVMQIKGRDYQVLYTKESKEVQVALDLLSMVEHKSLTVEYKERKAFLTPFIPLLINPQKEHGLKGVSPFAKLLHLLVNFMDADGSGNTLNPDCIEDEIYKLFNELYPKE